MLKRILQCVKGYTKQTVLTPLFMLGEVVFELMIPYLMSTKILVLEDDVFLRDGLCEVLQKEGYGVNGVYNQDFSSYTILIEIGGFESSSVEVLNTSLAFAECFMEVIKVHENKTTS